MSDEHADTPETEAHAMRGKAPVEVEAQGMKVRFAPETEAHATRVRIAPPAETEAHGSRMSPADPSIDALARIRLTFPAGAEAQVLELRYRPADGPDGAPEVELHRRHFGR